MNKKPLVILTGPTAVGKSDLAVRLAKQINGAIISADSMQVYKHMDIGSAKITPEEMQGVRHYLIDELMPDEEFHIVRFQQLAKKALEKICEYRFIPIISREMQAFADTNGAEALHEKLKAIDPISYETIHANNVKRVIRALEFYHLTGQPISKHNETERAKESPYNFVYFVLNDERSRLYQRIDLRVDKMMAQGLLEEVTRLRNMGYHRTMVSMQGLGYKEILDYLNGDISLEEAVYIIKRETRHFAKRQLTWFKHERNVTWLYKPDYHYDDDALVAAMCRILKEKAILKE